VTKNILTGDETAEVRTLILTNNQADLGKKFGKKMKDIRTVMAASAILGAANPQAAMRR